MGLLTMNGDSPGQLGERELAPQPGLARVPALIARIRESGVPVDLNVTGTAGPLPTGPDLTAYRVVQEALTNTLKHAVGAVVKVTIDHTTDTLLLEVTDSGGTRAPSADTGNGRGLIGLRERLALYGGTLEAGKQPAGGYRVRAVLPVEQP
jgi:signal transduction histidine kinase